jgi:hypothetical protein
MESPIQFGTVQSGSVETHKRMPWVAAKPPPSSFGDCPALAGVGHFFSPSNVQIRVLQP